ncbi:MAG: mandelate racemase/muconate lactonizing enzyme family protein [Alphaproteobacteria bacterium]|nr:mandelate racemase/muconate lactonizing enzyme family protein [Alphaproteobacteria bacterium]
MRIQSIEVYQRHLPYAGGVYRLSGGRTYETFDATFVRITTGCGLEGWGESTPFGSTYIAAHGRGVRAGIEEIAGHLIGLDPRHLDRINEVMDQALAGHLHAKAPIDIACWDVFGKAVDMTVADLLGGGTGERLPTISSVYAGDPEDMRGRVANFRAGGYRGHSIKVGASQSEGGPMLDAERIMACLADREPGEFFLVDANGGLTVEHALRMLRVLPRDEDFVLEAPCATFRECASLRRRTDVPIIMDELATDDASIAQIIADDAADGIGLKITKSGGLTRGRRQRDICLAAGLPMSVQDTTGSEIAFAAIVQLGATVPGRYLNCVLDCRDVFSVETAYFDAPVKDGGVLPPNLPGLGVTVDQEVMGEPVAVYG